MVPGVVGHNDPEDHAAFLRDSHQRPPTFLRDEVRSLDDNAACSLKIICCDILATRPDVVGPHSPSNLRPSRRLSSLVRYYPQPFVPTCSPDSGAVTMLIRGGDHGYQTEADDLHRTFGRVAARSGCRWRAVCVGVGQDRAARTPDRVAAAAAQGTSGRARP